MISRFDHAVIAVRDLTAAIDSYRQLGFDVSPGGRHTGRGTENAIIRFGLDYLELLAITDEAELGDSVLPEFLARRPGGLVGFALASRDLDEDARRFKDTGLDAVGPFAMERLRPDGRLLSWRLLLPGGGSWLKPWPFLIQWDQSDEQRLSWERPGQHANGAARVLRCTVAVHDLDRARDLYSRQLGLQVARGGSFSVGDFRIDLDHRPGGDHGIAEIVLGVRSLAEATRQLGLSMSREGGVRLPSELTQGAAIAFEEL